MSAATGMARSAVIMRLSLTSILVSSVSTNRRMKRVKPKNAVTPGAPLRKTK